MGERLFPAEQALGHWAPGKGQGMEESQLNIAHKERLVHGQMGRSTGGTHEAWDFMVREKGSSYRARLDCDIVTEAPL